MTKDRIVAAARKLMRKRGWTATTIEAIAGEAGVAVPTIYAAFGNKRAIVDAMRERMLKDSKIPDIMEQAASEDDPVEKLRLWARLVRQQMETSYDVISIHRQAAWADPDFAQGYDAVLRNRALAFDQFVSGIEEHLGAGMDTKTAADIVWALSNEELWRELIEDRGWSADRFERWLGATLVSQLLGPDRNTPA
jgi:AcrR family transcriptional regulator